MFSCSEDEDPSLVISQIQTAISDIGGSQSITFESNMNWTAKASESWCTISPASGGPSTKSITITTAANDTYDARSCTLTLTAGGLTNTFTINQSSNLGLIVSKDKYELNNDAATIKVEVKANIEYDITISDDWIKKVDTRGLSSTTIQFEIAKNSSYDNREGTITIKQKDGTLTSTIKVYQSQLDAIILSNSTENLSSDKQTLKVELKTNIDYELIIPEVATSWVSYAATRALRTETLTLDIAENEAFEARTTEVYVKNKSTNLSDTLTINQEANLGFTVSKEKFDLTNDASIIEVEVKANFEFDIIISDNWIKKIDTRGLTSTKLQFSIDKNISYDNREGSITIKQRDGVLTSTIKVYQSQQDAIILSNKTEDISNKSQTLEVELKTNIDFEVIIPDAAKSWVSHTETRALKTETLLLNITENEAYTARTTEVYVKNKATNLSDTLTINQKANLGFTVSKEKFDLTNDVSIIDVEVKANFEFDIIISDDWIEKINTRGLTSSKLQFNIAKNSSYDNREGTITIKQKDGALSSTIKVYQSQEDAIILSNKSEDISSKSQTLEVSLKTNVDFEVIIPDVAKSWVSYTPTRALRNETVLLNIAANESDEARSTEIYIKNKITSQQDTFIITQYGNEPNVYWVKKMGTLGTVLNQTQKDTITTMIVKGEINKADFEVMKKQMPELRHIDLKDVKCEGDKIPDEAFGEFYNNPNKNITTVVLPLNIKTIGNYAFGGCSGLIGSLNLPNELTKIDSYAFSDCSSLTGSLKLPTELVTIGRGAFSNCTGFSGSLNLPIGLKKIEEMAFSFCSGFTGSLNLPTKLTHIEKTAFYRCSGFTGVLTLPDSLISIGEWAFLSCNNLTGLVFGNSIVTIYEGAFLYCSNISGNVIFPISLRSIRKDGFAASYK